MQYRGIYAERLRSIELPQTVLQCRQGTFYRESVSMLAAGRSSLPCLTLSRSKFHSSSCVSFEKSASTAPALVPVAKNGEVVPGDQAKVAVLGISRSLTIPTAGTVQQGTSNVPGAAHAQKQHSRSRTKTAKPLLFHQGHQLRPETPLELQNELLNSGIELLV